MDKQKQFGICPIDHRFRRGVYNDLYTWTIGKEDDENDIWVLRVSGNYITEGSYAYCVAFLQGYTFNDAKAENIKEEDVRG